MNAKTIILGRILKGKHGTIMGRIVLEANEDGKAIQDDNLVTGGGNLIDHVRI